MLKHKVEGFAVVPKAYTFILHLNQDPTDSLSQRSHTTLCNWRMPTWCKLLNGSLENRKLLQHVMPQSSHVALSMASEHAALVRKSKMQHPLRHACNNHVPSHVSAHTTYGKRPRVHHDQKPQRAMPKLVELNLVLVHLAPS